MSTGTYARGQEYNELTAPFVEGYFKRFGETPSYTADTYSVIINTLAPAIEQAGTLDSDKIVPIMENRTFKAPSNNDVEYTKDPDGKPLHDLRWGPGYSTGNAVQWQNGKLVGVWPYRWKLTPDSPEVTYKGTVSVKIPPWVIAKYKK
jgi:branched-chain amino acid transport system substrate-binding protein